VSAARTGPANETFAWFIRPTAASRHRGSVAQLRPVRHVMLALIRMAGRVKTVDRVSMGIALTLCPGRVMMAVINNREATAYRITCIAVAGHICCAT
jgi:hypothetical protein